MIFISRDASRARSARHCTLIGRISAKARSRFYQAGSTARTYDPSGSSRFTSSPPCTLRSLKYQATPRLDRGGRRTTLITRSALNVFIFFRVRARAAKRSAEEKGEGERETRAECALDYTLFYDNLIAHLHRRRRVFFSARGVVAEYQSGAPLASDPLSEVSPCPFHLPPRRLPASASLFLKECIKYGTC